MKIEKQMGTRALTFKKAWFACHSLLVTGGYIYCGDRDWGNFKLHLE